MAKTKIFKFNKNRGFTLIEILVAVGIFVVVITIVISIFFNTIKEQRKLFVNQNLQENARFIMEMITKEVRMMKSINTATGEFSTLSITNQDGGAVIYKFETDQIKRDGADWGAGTSHPLNSTNVKVDGRFYVDNNPSVQQPRITIRMKVWPSDVVNSDVPPIWIQNTVTSRVY